MKLDFATLVIKEAFVESTQSYSRRVHALALFYSALFIISLMGLCVLVFRVKLYITLAQRSNVETLTLAFFFLFFLYMGCLSVPGFWGSMKILYANFAWGKNQQEMREPTSRIGTSIWRAGKRRRLNF